MMPRINKRLHRGWKPMSRDKRKSQGTFDWQGFDDAMLIEAVTNKYLHLGIYNIKEYADWDVIMGDDVSFDIGFVEG